MNINWRDILGEISGYKPLYEAKALELHDAQARIDQLTVLLTAANDTIRRLEAAAPTPAPDTPGDNTTQVDNTTTAPDSTTQGPDVSRRIREQHVIDCPRENRAVPLDALAAGANHDQPTCRTCPSYRTETCNYVTCKYEG
jgi:hypothetical protein